MSSLFDTDSRLWERFGRLFSDYLGEGQPVRGANGFVTHRAFPPLNLWEDNDNLYVECELPGVRMDDLDMAVLGRDLTLKGRRAPYASGKSAAHRRERDSGSFQRAVHLPVDIDAEKVSAQLSLGVLTITLPKAPEARPRKIEVECVAK